jgi:methyltransferase
MFDSIDSRMLYTALVGVVVVMRLVELAISRRNVTRLKARGAVEVGQSHYPVMVAVHTLFLAACLAEVWLADRPLVPLVASFSLGLLVGAAALRYWVLSTLGERWSTRILILPKSEPVDRGPFKHLRHPNYLAVVIEFAALPMVHTAYLTAIVFSAANAAILARRIRVEEAGLAEHSDYLEVMGGKPRMIPGAE